MDEMAKTLVFTGKRQIELREYPIPDVTDYTKAFESAIQGDKFRVVLKF